MTISAIIIDGKKKNEASHLVWVNSIRNKNDLVGFGSLCFVQRHLVIKDKLFVIRYQSFGLSVDERLEAHNSYIVLRLKPFQALVREYRVYRLVSKWKWN